MNPKLQKLLKVLDERRATLEAATKRYRRFLDLTEQGGIHYGAPR